MRTRYSAAMVLAAAGWPVGEVVRLVGFDRVEQAQVRSAPRWLRLVWVGPVAAMTLPWAIYVRPDVLRGDRRRLALLLLHELVHLRQWAELGVLRFLWRYLREYLVGRRRGLDHHSAYEAISLEREARRVVEGAG